MITQVDAAFVKTMHNVFNHTFIEISEVKGTGRLRPLHARHLDDWANRRISQTQSCSSPALPQAGSRDRRLQLMAAIPSRVELATAGAMSDQMLRSSEADGQAGRCPQNRVENSHLPCPKFRIAKQAGEEQNIDRIQGHAFYCALAAPFSNGFSRPAMSIRLSRRPVKSFPP